jgi:hypothetical protein
LKRDGSNQFFVHSDTNLCIDGSEILNKERPGNCARPRDAAGVRHGLQVDMAKKMPAQGAGKVQN